MKRPRARSRGITDFFIVRKAIIGENRPHYHMHGLLPAEGELRGQEATVRWRSKLMALKEVGMEHAAIVGRHMKTATHVATIPADFVPMKGEIVAHLGREGFKHLGGSGAQIILRQREKR